MLASLAACLAPAASQASDLTVVEAVFAHSVADRQYGKQVAPNSVARPIYFWTKLQGGPAAYSALKSQGKLPIRHYWTSQSVFESSTGQAIDPTQEADDRTLPAGRVTAFAGMETLVQNGQPFTWRTWTYKRAIWSGTWVVRILYADGQPVMCGAKACAFTITLGD